MKKDVKRAMAIVKVRGMSSSLAMPITKKIGRKTTTVVTVEAKMGMATSRAAFTMAPHREGSLFRCRWMFSSSTIESSTKRPTPRAKPPRVKRLRVIPEKYRTMNVTRMDKGMAMEMIRVLVRLRKNIRMTAEANSDPCQAG